MTLFCQIGFEIRKSTRLTEITKKMSDLPDFVSSNLPLLDSPDVTEKG
jgi:hypothetical protein